jgi:hypothetical protein
MALLFAFFARAMSVPPSFRYKAKACAQPWEIPAQAELGRGTLESKMNAIVGATRFCVW